MTKCYTNSRYLLYLLHLCVPYFFTMCHSNQSEFGEQLQLGSEAECQLLLNLVYFGF